jgi:phosphomevalonate kinase
MFPSAAPVVVSAPGKVMVSGEYVVLEGRPAVVAAASARVRVILSPRRSDRSPIHSAGSLEVATLPPEALLARACAEQAFGALPSMDLAIDTRALRSGDRKFGLGSSAATAVGVAAAIAASHGHDPSDSEVRARLLPLALAAHRTIAPEGSGADVVASVFGGFVRVCRPRRSSPAVSERDPTAVEVTPLDWPPSLLLALIWTGKPARTSELVGRVRDFAARDPGAYGRAMARLAEAASALLMAIERGDVGAAIEAAAAHGEAMARLGEAAGLPIVTAELARAADVARSVGGAAKPSGAGGGDVALAFLPGEAARTDLEAACREAGLIPLPLGLGDDGPRLEQ